MTDLSPAANAVLDAYMNNCGWLDGPLEKDYRCAAAVLRAAATAIGAQEMFHPDSKRTEGVKWCVQNIYAIADELEACCELLELSDSNAREFLCAARRPKPQSLKEQALAELSEWENVMDIAPDSPIRRALEALDD